jgi:hypothetical protein
MAIRLTTLQTVTQYGLARLRLLFTTRAVWSVLTVGSILLLAVLGTSAAWRARTGSADSEIVETDPFRSPAVERAATTAISPNLPAESVEPHVLSTPVQPQAVAMPGELPDGLRNPFTDTSIGDERAQRAETQRLRTTQQQLERVQTEVKIAEQHKELARLTQETRAIAHPPRAAKPAPPPSLPQLTVLSVSSTAALVQRGHWRQVVQRGARLNGWTVVRLSPTGITLRRAQRQVFFPLSFAARPAGAR